MNMSFPPPPPKMLNSSTLTTIARCLKPGGKGRILIVTDNRCYARLICRTIMKLTPTNMTAGEMKGTEAIRFPLVPCVLEGKGGLRLSESFTRTRSSSDNKGANRGGRYEPAVFLYEGTPSTGNGPGFVGTTNGVSYFDRLWRSGAGRHAEVRTRFVIAMSTPGSSLDIKNNTKNLNGIPGWGSVWDNNNAVGSSNTKDGMRSKKLVKKKCKTSKKRSATKQMERNQRRLLKKKEDVIDTN